MDDGLTDLPPGISLRQATHADRAFLMELYGTTRADELALVPWTEAEQAAFVRMQFDAQAAAYREAYPNGRFLVVEAGGEAIGRLILVRLEDGLRVADITLSPDRRGAGIGSALMAWILAGADLEGLAVTLHVEPWNPALRLYERLGFAVEEERGIYLYLRRPPRGQLKTAS